MEPKLLFNTTLGSYTPAEWTGKNESGMVPIGDHVLVLPDASTDITGGGIALTEDYKARMTLAAEAGTVIALGEGAFVWNSDKVTPFAGRKPKPGERVGIERYSGRLQHGKDGKVYRVMDSSCIACIYDEEPKVLHA